MAQVTDRKGNELNVGDRVTLAGRVKAVRAYPGGSHQVTLEPEADRPGITVDARLFDKDVAADAQPAAAAPAATRAEKK